MTSVADSSLGYDQDRKKRLYARCGIPAYWVVNMVDACLQVFRDPVSESYQSETVLRVGDTVYPVGCPNASIPVEELLP